MRQFHKLFQLLLVLLLGSRADAAETVWQIPPAIEPGQSVTIYYDVNLGSLAGGQDIFFFWGINADEQGNWLVPAESMIPAGSTVLAGEGVESPMEYQGDNIWSIEISTLQDVFSLDFYFKTETNADHNDGNDWQITVLEPLVTELPYGFTYDPRSSNSSVRPEDIDNVYLAGPFNNWSTSADRLLYNEESGVYFLERTLPLGETPYKFVVNGEIWTKDPDNPYSEGTGDDNSLAIVEPYPVPVFAKTRPLDQRVIPVGETVTFQAYIRLSGYASDLDGLPEMTLDGAPYTYGWVPSFRVMHSQLTLGEGVHEIVMKAKDNAGRQATKIMRFVVRDQGNGYRQVDLLGDDDGNGAYRYPENLWGAADFDSFTMYDTGTGELGFTIEMARTEPETRVLLQISSNLLGSPVDPAFFGTETATPEWNGIGLQICLADPESEGYDPDVHNRIINQRIPAAATSPVAVNIAGNSFEFVIPLDELENILGSFNRPWYFGGYSFLDGPAVTNAGAYEFDELHGGSSADGDPDAIDLLFVDRHELQQVLLSNYSSSSRGKIDEVGRGFALVSPEEISATIGSQGPPLRLLTGGGSTWHQEQEIVGLGEFETAGSVALIHRWGESDSQTYNFENVTDTFRVDVALQEGLNSFRAIAVEDGDSSFTPEMSYSYLPPHDPVAVIENSADGNIVLMDATGSYDPDEQAFSYLWSADESNPEVVALVNAESAVASFVLPNTSGEYYFDLTLEDPDGNTGRGRTLVTIYPDSADLFYTDKAARWVRDAIVYSIYPRGFVQSFHLTDVIDELDRIADLGVTAIWFTPIFPGPTGHGYEITNYRDINPDFGTLEDFADLVTAAHERGLKIILDDVYNHSALAHPFFQNTVIFERFSHYFDWYMRDAEGNYEYLFNWATLPNLNLDNAEAREYFIETSEWWVENYDVDGFRCDVAWGVQQRHEDFWVEWRERLKQIRPEILLLGEANAREAIYFNNRFDLVYDWYLHHEASQSFTSMFQGTPNPQLLHAAILNNGDGFAPYKAPFRFLENHDEDRFIANHTIPQTKLALSLLMTIPGVPMIYAGEEWGEATRREPLQRVNQEGMYQLVHALIHARRALPSLTSPLIDMVDNSVPTSVYSFSRYENGEVPVVVINNLSDSEVNNLAVYIDPESLGLAENETYYLNDVISHTQTQVTGDALRELPLSLAPYQSLVYAISDTVINLAAVTSPALPDKYSLKQNYPNPFNPSTTIEFRLPEFVNVQMNIYNLLGQRIATLADSRFTPGTHSITWDGVDEHGRAVASGMYIYQIKAGDFTAVRKMLLLK